MMVLDLGRADALHLAVALDAHARVLRDQHGVALPEAVEELRVAAWARAKGDSGRHDATAMAELAALLHRDRVLKLLLTLDEVGETLGRSRRSVERLIASGELVAVHVGGSTRVRVADVDKFVDNLAPAGGPVGERMEVKISAGGARSSSLSPGRRRGGRSDARPASSATATGAA